MSSTGARFPNPALEEVDYHSTYSCEVRSNTEKDKSYVGVHTELSGGLHPVRSLQHEVKELREDVQNTVGTGQALTRSMTGRSAAPSYRDPGLPPDGGLLAWTQAIMGHLVIFNTWGYIASYGVFQTYYTTTLGHPPSDISWIGSVQIFLLFFIGTFSGRAVDAGLFHHVFVSGFVLQLIGVFMTSLATKYWQLFVAQGVCTGLANGLQFCSTMSLISTYFSKKRAFAMGVAATGSATGGLVFPAIVRCLLPKIGFPWTVRVLGFVMLGIGCLYTATLRTRLPPRKSGPLVELSAFKEPTYVLYVFGIFFEFWALYFAFYYVGAFGRNIIGISYEESIDLLLIQNGIGILGRLIPNFFADRTFGPLNMIIPFAFATGAVFYAWIGVNSRSGIYTFACVYGLVSAGIQSLFPATLTSLTTDISKTGVRLGMGFTIVSFACLTGPPLAGALIERDDGRYLLGQVWAGTSMICGGCLLVAARLAKTGFVFRSKI
ncbi:MAG: hypothetical protein M1821_008710 [Bathelium mastoideum]|nr:MAG: hypothetical protein M1821_008710 [Bathelium mastoideum]